MTNSQYLLNVVLLVLVLGTNLGTRTVSRARFILPLLLVGVAAAIFLRNVPTIGNDVVLDMVGIAIGALLGLLAAALVRVGRDGAGNW